MDDTSKRIQNISTKKSARFAPLPAGGDNYADDDADNAWDDDEVTAEASEGGMWRQADRYTRKSNQKTGFMSQLRNSVRNSVMRPQAFPVLSSEQINAPFECRPLGWEDRSKL